jgi:hypothetical protein
MNPPASSVSSHLLKIPRPLELAPAFADLLLLLDLNQQPQTRFDYGFLALQISEVRSAPHQRVVNQNVNPHSRFFDV